MFHNKKFRKYWKKFWEPVLSIGLIQWIVAVFMTVPIWFVYFTSIKRVTNIEVFYKYRKKPAIFVFWHGRSMMLSPIICLGGMHAYAIASRHKDGRMMAKLQHLFGLRAIYGSSHKGGVSVLREGLRILAKGDHAICMSPDGPGGPSLRVKDGASSRRANAISLSSISCATTTPRARSSSAPRERLSAACSPIFRSADFSPRPSAAN